MNIAILGWGSLLWQPKVLDSEGQWHPDGPSLPIEFARISSRDRLTLVLYRGTEPIRTYWIRSSKGNLCDALRNLSDREGCDIKHTGFVQRNGDSHFHPMAGLDRGIREWLDTKPKLDAVIWADLRSDFRDKTGRDFTIESAIEWLAELRRSNRHEAAEEYFRKAPPQTDTPLRRRVRELFAWTEASTA